MRQGDQELARGSYRHLSWAEERYLALEKDWNIWIIDLRSREESVELYKDDPRCPRLTRYMFPNTLPDHRLGLVEWCGTVDAEDFVLPSSDECYLMAYDRGADSLEQLVEGALPDCSLGSGASDFTWEPDMTRGVQSLRGLRSTIYWISPSGFQLMPIVVTDGVRSWSLDANFKALEDMSRVDVGIATAPAWSPMGSPIGFLASLEAIGLSGETRSYVEYSVYLMDPLDPEPQAVLEGIYDSSVLTWSPDARWLAFNGRAGMLQQGGIWIFSPATGDLRIVARGSFRDVAWSPDSLQLAALRCVDQLCEEAALLLYDVTDLVSTTR